MSIQQVTYYKVECDGCGADAHEDAEYSAWGDDGEAISYADGIGWVTEIGAQRLDFCPGCSTGHADDPHHECSHNKVTIAAEKQWKCDDCGLEFGKPVVVETVDLLAALQASVDRARAGRPFRPGHRHTHPVTGHEVIVLNAEHAAELEALRAAGSGGEEGP